MTVFTNETKKIFLVVTIPTHLRVLMDAADLLHSSGRYEPVLIYYPSAVFDQNHANCQRARYRTFLWTSGRFEPKNINDVAALRAPVVGEQEAVREPPDPKSLVDRFMEAAYRVWLRIFPSLALSSGTKQKIHRSVSIVTFPFQHIILLIYPAIFEIYFGIKSRFSGPFVEPDHITEFRNKDPIVRYLLKYFSREWNSLAVSGQGRPEKQVDRFSNMFLVGMVDSLKGQRAALEGIAQLLTTENPAAVVLPEENLFYLSQFFVYAAHQHGIPTVVIPFTIVNTLEWAEAFFDEPSFQVSRGWNRIFSKVFPHWVLKHKGRRLILPREYILSCEYFDMVPDNPWLINSGQADAIASESEFMTAYYLNAGIRSEKIRLTGALSDDRLYSLLQSRNRYRDAIAAKYAILTKGKLVLIGLPPNQFGGGKRRGCEFDNFQDLANFLINTVVACSGYGATVMINLHPRIQRKDVDLLNLTGAIVIEEPIEQLVPLADVYVAVASATIRLGISCGIPVINYDAYQYDYDDYKNLDGVCEAKSKNQFKSLLNLLIHDISFYSKIKAAQEEAANRFCQIDGKAGERLLKLFDDISKTPFRK